MLINPLKNENILKKELHDISKVDAIGEIISYLINNYSEYLSDVKMNKIAFWQARRRHI